ncbi:hypothetical protein ACVK1X_000741 [Pseudomonas sp. PvR086]|jgi:hypothetical protein|nr:peptidase M12 [Pseudomonas sp. FW305-53]PMY85066.1 peptidase M12 [Pseudomonas sp. FW303-C2]PMY93418.1 peptidase M12 [Pseudomonas sp. FW305-62]PNA43442.1 peptidase M12 [Pseudomonas sp. FW306-2-2C-A10BC]PNA88175.1 peptidase M12 [Pseudomonas sp. MPR-R3B]PNB22982.1 peptidase M12 [Pseudomonas sp. FW305-67]
MQCSAEHHQPSHLFNNTSTPSTHNNTPNKKNLHIPFARQLTTPSNTHYKTRLNIRPKQNHIDKQTNASPITETSNNTLTRMTSMNLCKCIEPDDIQASYDAAINEDLANAPQTIPGGRQKRAVGDHTKFWKKGRTLKVAFLSTNRWFIEATQGAIHQWIPAVFDVRILFVEGSEGDIRISDDFHSGNWSVVGTDALLVPKDEPTMNLQWQGLNQVFFGNVLHEFGHALGLKHEHQHPDANINWNETAVYEFMSRTQKWSREEIYSNLLKKLEKPKTRTSPYDRTSIMHYPIQAELTLDGVAIARNNRLSANDVKLMTEIYSGR